MKPKIVHARDSDIMYQLSDLFVESKYSVKSEDKNYVLLKKNDYGYPQFGKKVLFSVEEDIAEVNYQKGDLIILDEDETLKHNSILLASLIFSYMMRNDYVVRY